MNPYLSLCLKITNWCNLNCAHCCEYSDSKQPLKFMPLEKIENYLAQSTQMFLPPDQLLCIGGGEAFAPYINGNQTYIPTALDMVAKHNFIPTLKTNGTWGNDNNLRKQILNDLSKSAYKSQKLVTLDISLDEFHNTTNAVAKIIRETLLSQELCMAIRICLVGFKTQQSKTTQNKLQKILSKSGFKIHETHNKDWIIDTPNGNGVYMVNDFNGEIFNLGRAKDTHVYTAITPQNDTYTTNCLQIDNNDMAILNYKYREPINNRHLNEVLYSLMAHASMHR